MTNLAFIDLETTGLDSEQDTILEVGIVIYDTTEKRVVAQKNWVLYHPQYLESLYDTFVVKMHTENGLWDECAKSKILYEDVEKGAIEFLAEHDALRSPMCGNTIHFDRAFLKDGMPDLESVFHYRNLDISTLNNIAQFFPERLTPAPKTANHRAIQDCLSSINQLEFYLEQFRSDRV